jgi:hypothetical protein
MLKSETPKASDDVALSKLPALERATSSESANSNSSSGNSRQPLRLAASSTQKRKEKDDLARPMRQMTYFQIAANVGCLLAVIGEIVVGVPLLTTTPGDEVVIDTSTYKFGGTLLGILLHLLGLCILMWYSYMPLSVLWTREEPQFHSDSSVSRSALPDTKTRGLTASSNSSAGSPRRGVFGKSGSGGNIGVTHTESEVSEDGGMSVMPVTSQIEAIDEEKDVFYSGPSPSSSQSAQAIRMPSGP